MSARSLAALAAVAAIVAGVDPAGADPCDEPIDEPIAVGWRDAAFDAGRSACLHTDVAFTARGRALVDTDGFYGTLGGDAAIAARFVEGTRWEWGLAARAVDVAFIQNAVWTLVEPSYGPLTLHGAHGRALTLAGRPARWAAVATVELPYTRSAVTGSAGAIQLAGVMTWAVRPRLRLHGRVAALGWYARAETGTTGRAAAAVAVDASWRGPAWMTFHLGLDLQAGWYRDGLDHLAVRAGAHWRVRGPWRAGLAAGTPLVGVERQDLAATLGVRRDLD